MKGLFLKTGKVGMQKSSVPSLCVLQVSLEYVCDQEEAYAGPCGVFWAVVLKEGKGLGSIAPGVACPTSLLLRPKPRCVAGLLGMLGGHFVRLTSVLMS